jgi:hypothetical protein
VRSPRLDYQSFSFVLLTCHGMPDIGVDRCRANPDQHLEGVG